jgi:hypothetical protein
MTSCVCASAILQRRRFAEATANLRCQRFTGLSTNLQRWRFADPSANRFAEASNEAVIPDLVSEERVESVGNPCLNVGRIKTGEEQPAPGTVAFRPVGV